MSKFHAMYPNGVANDAFRLSWENKKFYAFPPFSLIGAALVKIRRDQSINHDYSLVGSPILVPINAATPTRLSEFIYHRERIHCLYHQRKGKFIH